MILQWIFIQGILISLAEFVPVIVSKDISTQSTKNCEENTCPDPDHQVFRSCSATYDITKFDLILPLNEPKYVLLRTVRK